MSYTVHLDATIEWLSIIVKNGKLMKYTSQWSTKNSASNPRILVYLVFLVLLSLLFLFVSGHEIEAWKYVGAIVTIFQSHCCYAHNDFIGMCEIRDWSCFYFLNFIFFLWKSTCVTLNSVNKTYNYRLVNIDGFSCIPKLCE